MNPIYRDECGATYLRRWSANLSEQGGPVLFSESPGCADDETTHGCGRTRPDGTPAAPRATRGLRLAVAASPPASPGSTVDASSGHAGSAPALRASSVRW